MLENGASYAEVADWLNAQGVPPGPYARSPSWDGPMVARVTHNPIYKGVRERNRRKNKRINKTGKRRSVKAPPEELLTRECPHLAFFDKSYYDRVIRLVDRRNARYRRKGRDGIDTRKGVSRKRTVWPGQHLRCGVCNRIYHWTGKRDHRLMRCSGAQTWRCWNAVEVNGLDIAARLLRAVFDTIAALPEFDEEFTERVRAQRELLRARRDQARHQVRARLEEIMRQQTRLAEAIAAGVEARVLVDRLRRLEAEEDEVKAELEALEAERPPNAPLPSVEDLKARARELLNSPAPENQGVARLLRILIPSLKVYPHQLCDGGSIVLRARLKLNLASLAAAAADLPSEVLEREIVVDLFDPPQRERFRREIIALRSEGLTERQTAARLGITQPVVQRAAALQRLMDRMGIVDPYLPVLEPRDDCGFRRHLHPRYRFEPEGDGEAA